MGFDKNKFFGKTDHRFVSALIAVTIARTIFSVRFRHVKWHENADEIFFVGRKKIDEKRT